MVGRESFSTASIRHQQNIILLMAVVPLTVMALVVCTFYITNGGSKTRAQVATGPSLVYLSDGKNVLVGGVKKPLVNDIRYDGQAGTIVTGGGGTTYTSYPNAERTEQYIGAHVHPVWSDTSSGWFAFDFTVHDMDSSWRVIEQEHEGDASPSRALEAFEGGSSTQIKLCSRYGTPNTNGCAKSWTFNSSVGTRIQMVGYEKFGQGDAVMQAWWRPYGASSWTQFANSSGFSMGYTSGNPGRYHKRGTYHGNHAEQSSITWYGTAVMFSSRSAAESAIGFSGTSPPPTPPPPAPSPVLSPSPSPPPTPAPSPSPPPPINVPGTGTSEPVLIPDELEERPDGSLIADFNGDGLNDLVKDTDGDGKIDPKLEIIEDGTTDSILTDITQSPLALHGSASLEEQPPELHSSTFIFKPGPLPEVTLAKPVAYTFLIVQGFAITGIGTYLAVTKLSIFAGMRGRWGL